MYSSKLHVRSCAGSFSVSTVHSILFYNTLTYFITYLNFHRTQQRLSFSLLIILYCLFIVPECSTTLFVYMSMSSALDCYCWLPAACLLSACLLPLGTSGCPLHIRVRPVMSHFLYHLVCGECCHSILCLLTADAWSPCLICFLCRRSHLLRSTSCVYWYLNSLLPT